MCGSSLIWCESRKTTALITPLICSSGHTPSRILCGRPLPFGRKSAKPKIPTHSKITDHCPHAARRFACKRELHLPDPPSADGPNMLCTRLAYRTNVGYGMSYFLAACDNDRPSFRTEKIASAIVSGRQDFSGPRSRNRKLCTRLWLVFQHFCHIDCNWYW